MWMGKPFRGICPEGMHNIAWGYARIRWGSSGLTPGYVVDRRWRTERSEPQCRKGLKTRIVHRRIAYKKDIPRSPGTACPTMPITTARQPLRINAVKFYFLRLPRC